MSENIIIIIIIIHAQVQVVASHAAAFEFRRPGIASMVERRLLSDPRKIWCAWSRFCAARIR